VVSVANGFDPTVELEKALGEEWAYLYGESWSAVYGDRPRPVALTETTEDNVAVQVVQLLGLVPMDSDRPALTPAGRLKVLSADDPLFGLLAHLGGQP
jgi:hypothetical protein